MLEEANLKTKTDGAARGTKTRCADMLKGNKTFSYINSVWLWSREEVERICDQRCSTRVD